MTWMDLVLQMNSNKNLEVPFSEIPSSRLPWKFTDFFSWKKSSNWNTPGNLERTRFQQRLLGSATWTCVLYYFVQLVNCPFSQAELNWLCQSSKQILLTTAATEITIRGRMEDRKMKKLFFLVSRSHPAVHTQDVSRQDVYYKQSCFRFPKSFKQTYCRQLFYRKWVLQYHHTYRISNAGIFGG